VVDADPLPDDLLKLIGEEVGAALGIGPAAVDVRALVAGQRSQQPLGKGPEEPFDRGLIGWRERPGWLDRLEIPEKLLLTGVTGAGSVLTPCGPTGHLPAETARWSTITQIYEGTNQIQRVVMARQLLK
jgi:hypothetical protein